MTTHASLCLLDDLGVLRFRGADARKFLQGQLSNDVDRLSPDTLLRAALNNPQGRTMALMGLLAGEDGDVLALMPRELTSSIGTLLKRYVLRSKVAIGDESASFRILGLDASEVTAAGVPPGQLCRYGLQADQRMLLLQSAASSPQLAFGMSRESWRALDIAAGLPWLSSVLSGEFVAQMLNLDCIDAISFNKGCYTGQEVIARAHYRGRVKRRMQRFLSDGPAALTAGASGHLQDGRSFRVIDAVTRADARCDFLAVAPLTPSANEPGESLEARSEHIAARTLALPYPLPE